MTSRSIACGFLMLGISVGLGSLTGCGSSSPEAGHAQTRTESRNASLRRSIDIVGIWLGQAKLDREGLDRHLETLTDPNERLRIAKIADTFQSITIAMDFRTDSTMEIEVEIVPPGEAPFRRSSLGKYRIVASDEKSITLDCSEEVEPGKFEDQTLTYEFSADKNHLTTTAPVGDDLKAFQPQFVFERCDDTQVAEQPAGESTILR